MPSVAGSSDPCVVVISTFHSCIHAPVMPTQPFKLLLKGADLCQTEASHDPSSHVTLFIPTFPVRLTLKGVCLGCI